MASRFKIKGTTENEFQIGVNGPIIKRLNQSATISLIMPDNLYTKKLYFDNGDYQTSTNFLDKDNYTGTAAFAKELENGISIKSLNPFFTLVSEIATGSNDNTEIGIDVTNIDASLLTSGNIAWDRVSGLKGTSSNSFASGDHNHNHNYVPFGKEIIISEDSDLSFIDTSDHIISESNPISLDLQIKDNVIETSNLVDNAVTTSKILDNNITVAKILKGDYSSKIDLVAKANNADIAKEADKLSNDRTLWGQTFNGTQNVSGNISNTGNIIPETSGIYDLGTSTNKYRDLYLSGDINANDITTDTLTVNGTLNAGSTTVSSLLSNGDINATGHNIISDKVSTKNITVSENLTVNGTQKVAGNLYLNSDIIYNDANGDKIYTRNDKTFHGNLDGNAESANKLSQTRKFWGNNFDGSVDVTGDIELGGRSVKNVSAITTNTGTSSYIGEENNRFANIYATNIHGNLDGNATTATTANQVGHSITISGLNNGNNTFNGSSNRAFDFSATNISGLESYVQNNSYKSYKGKIIFSSTEKTLYTPYAVKGDYYFTEVPENVSGCTLNGVAVKNQYLIICEADTSEQGNSINASTISANWSYIEIPENVIHSTTNNIAQDNLLIFNDNNGTSVSGLSQNTFVKTSTDQTISGNKTFSNNIYINGDLYTDKIYGQDNNIVEIKNDGLYYNTDLLVTEKWVDDKYLSYTTTQATVLGTEKSLKKITGQLFAQDGIIFGGTAAQAGLVTRGICGIGTPDSNGSCEKTHLFINFDGTNDYNAGRQLILQAVSEGKSYGNNVYQYAAVRGDALKNYTDANFLPLTGGTLNGNITANQFIKSGGTNTQVLLADGSVKEISTFKDDNTTYSFENGTNGNFYVTPSNGSRVSISIGKPATAGTADTAIMATTASKVAHKLSFHYNNELLKEYDGSSEIDFDFSDIFKDLNGVKYKGTIDFSSTTKTLYTPFGNAGDLYFISCKPTNLTGCTLNGVAVSNGDMVLCKTDNTVAGNSNNQASVSTNWSVIKTNNIDDANLVHKNGDETISGNKTFSGKLILNNGTNHRLYTSTTNYLTVPMRSDETIATDENIKSSLRNITVNGTSYNLFKNELSLAKVASTGNYNDLSNKPTISINDNSDISKYIYDIDVNDHTLTQKFGFLKSIQYNTTANSLPSNSMEEICGSSNSNLILNKIAKTGLSLETIGSGNGISSVEIDETDKSKINVSYTNFLTAHQNIKTLNTNNSTTQTATSEEIAGSGTINLHKISKTGNYDDLLNKPTIPTIPNITVDDDASGTFITDVNVDTTDNHKLILSRGNIPTASTTAIGGIKISGTTSSTVTDGSSNNYVVKLDSQNKAFVTVPVVLPENHVTTDTEQIITGFKTFNTSIKIQDTTLSSANKTVGTVARNNILNINKMTFFNDGLATTGSGIFTNKIFGMDSSGNYTNLLINYNNSNLSTLGTSSQVILGASGVGTNYNETLSRSSSAPSNPLYQYAAVRGDTVRQILNYDLTKAAQWIRSDYISSADLNNYKSIATCGFYYASGGNSVVNKPSGIDAFGLIVMQSASSVFTQILYSYLNETLYTRHFYNDWTAWKKLSTQDWANNTFAPKTHTHDDRYYTETEADNRFAPKSHSHSYLPLTGGTISGTLSVNDTITANTNIILKGRMTSGVLDTHPEGGGTVISYYTNDLAFLLSRGGSCEVKNKNTGDIIDIQSKENMFDGSTSYSSFSISSVNDVVEIIVKAPKIYSFNTNFGIGFGTTAWTAKNVKIESGYSATNTGSASSPDSDIVWKTNLEVTNSTQTLQNVLSSGPGPNTSWQYIRITLTNFYNTSPRIAQIWSINYGSTGLHNTFLSRGGGTLYGNLILSKEGQSNGAIVLSSNTAWPNYTTAIYCTDSDHETSDSGTPLAKNILTFKSPERTYQLTAEGLNWTNIRFSKTYWPDHQTNDVASVNWADNKFFPLTGGTISGENKTSILWPLSLKNTFNGDVPDQYGVGLKLNLGNSGETTKWCGIAATSTSSYANTSVLSFYADEAERIRLSGSSLYPLTTNNIDLGSTSNYFRNVYAYKFIKNGGTSSQLLLADGSVKNTSDFSLSTHTHSYLPLTGGTLSGNLSFSGTNHIDWNSDNIRQRITVIDDASNNTDVFKFQQSTNAGSSYTDLFKIRDNGGVIATGQMAITGNNQLLTTNGRLNANVNLGSVTGAIIGSNGIGFTNPTTMNDAGWMRVLGTSESDTVLEIATGDDGVGETIRFRGYSSSGSIAYDVAVPKKTGTIALTSDLTDNDTKNTAGATNNTSKLYLVGATEQTANPQTYSNTNVYATNGTLTTTKTQVGNGAVTIEYNSTDECLDFIF